ncbi:MAG TPA: carbohydrate kinase family protein [Pseudorhizobium sp.]|nr:carbohydrate kinase family protein [Pseudorhizobium sp.]
MRKRILVLGGAHLDRRGRISGETAPGASNPGVWMEEIGGGAFNVARNLSLLGHDVTMVSPRGGDATADQVASAAEVAGVTDCPFVFLDRATPSYTAILERDGNLVIALADMDLYRLFSPRRLRTRALRERMANADLIICDANLPADTLTALAAIAVRVNVPVAGVAISPAKVVRFTAALPDLDWLFMNSAEAAALCSMQDRLTDGWPDLLRALHLRAAVVTDGSRSLTGYRASDTVTVTPPPLEELCDVTGAGDALAAGTIDAILHGMPLQDALIRGVAASRITLRSHRSVAPELSRQMLEREAALVAERNKVF